MPHPLATMRRRSSRAVRAAQRRHTAELRARKHKAIMEASPGDQAVFHKLVKEHLKQPEQLNTLLVEGELITDPASIMDNWADYFEFLSTPGNTAHWNDQYRENHSRLVQLLKQCPRCTEDQLVEEHEITEAISELNTTYKIEIENFEG